MIKKLKCVTSDGNKLELTNAPEYLGIELLFGLCTLEEKQQLIKTLESKLKSTEQ